MPLPSPYLDDRKFQDIVDDLKRQIALRCPEWTDHNVHDPGVTLIELFAWITEGTLYRLNQVPERNYIRFLEMLGISLEPELPARTALCFRLSRPISDEQEAEAFEQALPAYQTVAATLRTETEEAIEFLTEMDLKLVRPRLTTIFAAQQAPGAVRGLDVTDVRLYEPTSPELINEFDDRGKLRTRQKPGFPIFSPRPQECDAIYFGFDADISGNLLELSAVCNRSAAVGLDEEYPAQVWEYWDAAEKRWDRVLTPTQVDTTCGFNESGAVELLLPHGLLPCTLNNQSARWIRCRYTTSPADLPPRGKQELRPSEYSKSPEVFSFSVKTIGGSAPAAHCKRTADEVCGKSDGTPGQVFRLRYAPLLPRRIGETVLVGPEGALPSAMEAWTEVADFSESGPTDRHFVCDSLTGEIAFGPFIPQPDGTYHQYGAVPPMGQNIVFTAYRFGGGTQGNVREQQVRVLKSAIPYIDSVWNYLPATGGQNQETIEHAKMRGQASLRIRERAVTAEDYEFLAQRASSGVGRAHCMQPAPRHAMGRQGEQIPPGVVRMLIVPALNTVLAVPRPFDLRLDERTRNEVYAYLDTRRMLTTVLEVTEPDYLYLSTDITLVANPAFDAEQVARGVRRQLEGFLHPLTGGPNGEGWPFLRPCSLADIYAQVGATPGVAFLLDAKIYISRLVNPETGQLSPEELVSNQDGVRPEEHEILCTREHRIRVRPMWAVGGDTPE